MRRHIKKILPTLVFFNFLFVATASEVVPHKKDPMAKTRMPIVDRIPYMTVYFEARGEPIEGQVAVFRVLENRARLRKIPLYEVCLEKRQFCVWNNTTPSNVRWGKKLQRFSERLDEALKRPCDSFLKIATHFHNPKKVGDPNYYFDPRCIHLGAIGDHVFYAFRRRRS